MEKENTPSSLEELDQLIISKQKEKNVVIWPYIIGSLFAPPFSLLLACMFSIKKKVFYYFLPTAVIVHSLVLTLTVISLLYPIMSLQNTLGDKFFSSSKLQVSLMAIVYLIALVCGVYFRNKAKVNKSLSKFQYSLLILLLVLIYTAGYIVIISGMSIIYDISNY